jgi:hypothetical protein
MSTQLVLVGKGGRYHHSTSGGDRAGQEQGFWGTGESADFIGQYFLQQPVHTLALNSTENTCGKVVQQMILM